MTASQVHRIAPCSGCAIELEAGEKVVGVATLAEKETDEVAGNGGENGSAGPSESPEGAGDGPTEEGPA